MTILTPTSTTWQNFIRKLYIDGIDDVGMSRIDGVHQDILNNLVSLNTNKLFSVKGTFDATGGRAIGTYDTGLNIPHNAIIIRTYIDVLTEFDSGTDTAELDFLVQGNTVLDANTPAPLVITDGYLALGPHGGNFGMQNMFKINADDITITGRNLGTGNNLTDHFIGNLNVPAGTLTPSTITITSLTELGGAISVTDNGAGILNGGQANGTVNYATGEIDITFTVGNLPGIAQPILAQFDYNPNPGPGRNLLADVTVEALTAGKVNIFVEYVISE